MYVCAKLGESFVFILFAVFLQKEHLQLIRTFSRGGLVYLDSLHTSTLQYVFKKIGEVLNKKFKYYIGSEVSYVSPIYFCMYFV
jgi:hypothetical protein